MRYGTAHVGMRVRIISKDKEYLDDRGIKNGDWGIITRISDSVNYPIRVGVVNTNGSIGCSFNPDELRPFKNKGKIL